MNVAPGGENISHFDMARLAVPSVSCVYSLARASLRLGAVLEVAGDGQGKA